MKLPRRGILVDIVTGFVIWAWEHNDPDHEFDSLPPVITRTDGSVVVSATPDAVILDCEAEFEVGDIPLLYAQLTDVRIRKNPQQKWEFFLEVKGKDEQGKDVSVEVPHPIEAIRAARKKAKEPKL